MAVNTKECGVCQHLKVSFATSSTYACFSRRGHYSQQRVSSDCVSRMYDRVQEAGSTRISSLLLCHTTSLNYCAVPFGGERILFTGLQHPLTSNASTIEDLNHAILDLDLLASTRSDSGFTWRAEAFSCSSSSAS